MLVKEMENGDVGYISENAIVVLLPKVEYSIVGIYTVVKDDSGFRKIKVAKTMDIVWADYSLFDPTSVTVISRTDNTGYYPVVLLPTNALDAIIAKYVTRKHKVILHDGTSVIVRANHFDSHDGILYFWNDGIEKYSRINIAKFAKFEWKYVTEA